MHFAFALLFGAMLFAIGSEASVIPQSSAAGTSAQALQARESGFYEAFLSMADHSVIRDAGEFKDSKSLSFWYFGLPKYGKPRVMRDRESFARSTGCLRANLLESDTCARYTGATEAGNQNVTRIVEWRLKTNTDSISSLIKELIVTTNQPGLVGRQDPQSCHPAPLLRRHDSHDSRSRLRRSSLNLKEEWYLRSLRLLPQQLSTFFRNIPFSLVSSLHSSYELRLQ
ncbi:hypothetical protein CF319_g7007 [Tilletia indica]|nr:hypothetical protein CF319_g7007 [Tilletia indica]